MKRKIAFATVLACVVGCLPARAKEPATMQEADKLYDAGRFDAARAKYDETARAAKDDDAYTRALLRAVECTSMLRQFEEAAGRAEAARLPGATGLRAAFELVRLESWRTLENRYGAGDATEEKPDGPAKRSKREVRDRLEAAAGALWQDRAALARLPLRDYGRLFLLDDTDFEHYPSLWDFVVLRLSDWLSDSRWRVEPMPVPPAPVQYTVERWPVNFEPTQAPAARLASLYEESGQLDGGPVQRASAAERWRVARVMLGENAPGNRDAQKVWKDHAREQLVRFVQSFKTPLGRGEAAAKAAALYPPDQQPAALQLIKSVLPAVPESDVAVALREAAHRIVAEELGLTTQATRDGKGALTLKTRNLAKVYLRLFRVDPKKVGADDFWSQRLSVPSQTLTETLMKGAALKEWTLTTADKGNHVEVQGTFDLPVAQLGFYLVVASSDPKFTPRRAHTDVAFANVTDLAIARAQSDGGLRYYAFSAAKGEPVAADVHLQVSHDWRTRTPVELHTNGEGLASWSFPDARYQQVDALVTSGQSVALFNSPSYQGQSDSPSPLALYLLSDRPIYRPGQVIKVRVTSIERHKDGTYKIDAHRRLRLALHDPNDREVAHAEVTSGELGSADAELTIPTAAPLGDYSVTVKVPGLERAGTSLSLAVEEYKRPEFEITLEAPTKATRYGEQAALSGHVRYYFGGAAGAVPIQFKVSRRRWLPFWYWRPITPTKVEIARGEVKSDASGHFTVAFTAVPDPEPANADDPEAPDVSDYVVEVEGHDVGGRTIQAERDVRVGAQRLLLSGQPTQGYFTTAERPTLNVTTTNLELQPIAGEVEWEVERLGAPQATATDPELPLQVALRGYPTAQAGVAHGKLRVGADGKGSLELAALPAGGYRVKLHGDDARSALVILIADAKSGAVPLALPPLALVKRAEVQPGQEAELLVGSATAAGAYHLELWRGQTLVQHRLERGAPLRVWKIPVGSELQGGFTARWIGAAGVTAVGSDITVAVPRKDKLLHLALVDAPEAIEPGKVAHLTVQAKDENGHPVAGEAAVTIYDRSLELYAHAKPEWATRLWDPPPPPQERAGGLVHVAANSLPDDELMKRIRDEIDGAYKPKRPPRLWQAQTRSGMRYFGQRSAPMMAAGMPPSADGGAGRSGKSIELAASAEPSRPAVRTNMAETAAWAPHVRLDSDGRGTLQFTAPERLSSWRVQLAALGKAVQAGTGEATFATRKPLMVRLELPRFFRERDRSTVTVVVHNETAAPLRASLEVEVLDAAGKPADAALSLRDPRRSVAVPAHGLAAADFVVTAPDGTSDFKLRAHATSGKLADAEERPLPVLASRERLLQSKVVALDGKAKEQLAFDELLHAERDPSLRSESMTVAIDPQLALSVLRALPFLVDYPYDCVDQVTNRYVPLAIVQRIFAKYPALAKAAAASPPRKTVKEPWDASDPRRLMRLEESPWLAASQGGDAGPNLKNLLDPALVERTRGESLAKLQQAQGASGGFSWIAGGRDDLYMTLYVLEQLALLEELGVATPNELVGRALDYLGKELPEALKRSDQSKDEGAWTLSAYGAYVATAFDEHKVAAAGPLRAKAAEWMKVVLAHRQLLSPYGRALAARTMARLGVRKEALALLESAFDGAKRDPLVGLYFTPERYSWRWYSDSVEKHAFLLRTLMALLPDDPRIGDMTKWLLFNRKGNEWHSTKASAAAVYAVLAVMEKRGALTKAEKFHVTWDKQEELVTVKPNEDRRTPLSWTVRGAAVTPARGQVTIGKEGPGLAFASATWIFSSTKPQAAHGSNLVSMERTYFRKEHRADGDHLVPLKSGDRVHVGESIEVRLTIKTQSQFEYVHIKEPRGAGFEETLLTSGWRWSPLARYEEPRDSLTNFFVAWLPQGEYVLSHSLRPTTPGKYQIGSAVLQSMYSPDVSAYSSGLELEVVRDQ